jgi:hypothetical protein
MDEQIVEGALNQNIVLHTVDSSHMPFFISANGRCRRCDKVIIQLTIRPDPPKAKRWWSKLGQKEHTRLAVKAYDEWQKKPDINHFPNTCECEVARQIPVIGQQNTQKGQTLAICGAGPSLARAKASGVLDKVDQVWACNRAANYMTDKGWPITHAVSIDPGEAMWKEAWADPPDVEQYILATTVAPELTDHLLKHDKKISFFHSLRGGFEGELDLYRMLYPPAPLVGRGLNVVNRTLELADWLGYDTIYLVGADNCLAPGDRMYAGGMSEADVEDPDAICRGEIMGHTYSTRPDMLASAKSLAEVKFEMGERVRFVGHKILPRALYEMEKKEPGYLDRCIMYASAYEQKMEGKTGLA